MQPATGSTVAGDFADATFSEHGVTTRFFRRGDRFLVDTQGPDGERGELEVVYTFGVEPLQQYLVAASGGRLHALTIAWDTRRRAWFSLYPEQPASPGDPLHWTGRLNRWNDRCAECHSTDLRVNFDAASNTYRTTWAAINVGCQACHGPGSAHVEWATSTARDGAERADYAQASRLLVDFREPDRTAEVFHCARCHARRSRATAEDAHDRAFLDDYELALLREDLYHADGQILDEVYVTGSFLQSRMYRRGVTCSDCHDPHSGRMLAAGNALCTRCHRPDPPAAFPTLRAALYDSREHHHHEPDGAGSACVDCHMPERTYMQVDARRDHSIRIPRPDLSVQLGTPNACAQCHADRSAEWAAAAVRAWFPAPRRPHYATIIAAGRRGDPDARRSLAALAADTGQPGIVRATAVDLLGRYTTSGHIITRFFADPDPLVRLAAVTGIAGRPEAAAAEPLLLDRYASIRSAAARALVPYRTQLSDARARQAFDSALHDYRLAQQAQADQPEALYNLGGIFVALGHPDSAADAYARAIAIDSAFGPAYQNLAILDNRSGRNADAERVLRSGIARAADASELHYSLGLLLAELGRMPEAASELRLAAGMLATRARVHYNYGLALQQIGRPDEAEAALQRAAALAPADPTILLGLAYHYRSRGRWADAERYARELVGMQPDDPGMQRLLEEIRARRQ